MTHLLRTACALAIFAASAGAASAETRPWCLQNAGQGFLCALGVIVVAGVADAIVNVDASRSDRPPPAADNDDGPLQQQLASPFQPQRRSTPGTDFSADYGCAWGSRAYGTCQ